MSSGGVACVWGGGEGEKWRREPQGKEEKKMFCVRTKELLIRR